jgi:serine protease Do
MRTLVLVLALSSLALAQSQAQSHLRALSNQFQSIVEKVDPAVVQIITRNLAPSDQSNPSSSLIRSSRGTGSGIIVDPNGYIVTNAHVVGSVKKIEVLLPQPADPTQKLRSVVMPSGRVLLADVIGIDRETDIAVLKIDRKNLPHLPFGDSESIRQGNLVLAFGSPLGLDNSVTMGIVSNIARQVRPDDPVIYIQTDAAINPGNSGGPLVDSEGNLIGVNTFILTQSGGSEGIGFAVPSRIVQSVYEQIRAHGRVRRGQIGVLVQTISPPLAKALNLSKDWGVLIEDVSPGSSAQVAGLQVKDVILTLNGKVMENGRQFGVNIYQNAGKTIDLEVERGQEKLNIRVAVLERPKDPDRILSLLSGPENNIRQLGILAIELTEKVTPMLPALRKFTGVVVAGVISDQSSGDGRLQAGDVIHEINGKQILDLAGLKAALAPFAHGETVALQIDRQGQLQFVLLDID